MSRRPTDPPPPVGHTCLAIDKMKQVVRRSVPYGPDRETLLNLLETLRAENTALRARLVWHEEEIAKLEFEGQERGDMSANEFDRWKELQTEPR